MAYSAFEESANVDALNHPILNLFYYVVSAIRVYIAIKTCKFQAHILMTICFFGKNKQCQSSIKNDHIFNLRLL